MRRGKSCARKVEGDNTRAHNEGSQRFHNDRESLVLVEIAFTLVGQFVELRIDS